MKITQNLNYSNPGSLKILFYASLSPIHFHAKCYPEHTITGTHLGTSFTKITLIENITMGNWCTNSFVALYCAISSFLSHSLHTRTLIHAPMHEHTHTHTHTHALINYTLFVFFLKFFFHLIIHHLQSVKHSPLSISQALKPYSKNSCILSFSLSYSYTHFLMEAVARKQNLYPISFQLSKYRIAICKRTAECFKPLQKGYFFYRALLLQIWLTDYGSRDSCP